MIRAQPTLDEFTSSSPHLNGNSSLWGHASRTPAHYPASRLTEQEVSLSFQDTHSLCLSHHYFYLVFQWGSQRLFLQPAVWMEVLAGSRSLQFLSKRYTDWEWAWKTFEGFTICEGTYFPRWWEQCLGPAGLPARLWVLHYLLTHGKKEACWNKLKLEASGSQQRNSETVLPGTGTGAPFSSIISNLSCWPVGGLSLLQSLTPTHSWGNSSVANTSSSNIGRESGSLMASCCETVTKETRKTK